MAVVVYLGTSDYSRFGDVIRGKGTADVELLYKNLLSLKDDGLAIFACSMPLLAELLQYDATHSETTICKARAVEALCGEHAFIYPARMVALEVAVVAHSEGLIEAAPVASRSVIRGGARPADQIGSSAEC